jgi:hypothetical protein
MDIFLKYKYSEDSRRDSVTPAINALLPFIAVITFKCVSLTDGMLNRKTELKNLKTV